MGEGAKSDEELATSLEEVQGLAEQAKSHIIAIQGHQSEKLIEIYCLYSFFAFRRQDFEQGMAFQEMATQLTQTLFGEKSLHVIQRLKDQI